MKRALVYGSVAASYCVEAFGPNKLKELGPDDIKARTLEFVNLMQVTLEDIR
jgi:hypothetical protein